MADFCKACSLETFGEDFGDLAGLVSAQEDREGFVGCGICEGCGSFAFHHDGSCADCFCEKHGEANRAHYGYTLSEDGERLISLSDGSTPGDAG